MLSNLFLNGLLATSPASIDIIWGATTLEIMSWHQDSATS